MTSEAQAVATTVTAGGMDSTQGHMLLAMILSVVLKFVVDALRSITNPKDSVAQAIPWITAVFGIAIGALDYFIGGASATDAVLLGGFGAGSTAVNEMGKLLRRALSKTPPPAPPGDAPSPPSDAGTGGAAALAILVIALGGCSPTATYVTLGAVSDTFLLGVGKLEVYTAARRREILAEAKPSCAEKATAPEVEACFTAATASFEAARRPVSACIDGAAPLVRAAEKAVEAKDAKAAASLLPDVTAGATKCGLAIEEYMKATKKAEVRP